jgi:hypothetical protein
MSKSVRILDDPKKVTPPGTTQPVTQPPAQTTPTPELDDMSKEMQLLYKRPIAFDNKPAIEVARSAALKTGVNPALLFSSAYQEGMNKAIADPDEVSVAYTNAEKAGLDTKTYPVDGFYSYGLDTFGGRYEQLKKYLPEGFDKRFKTYDAKNEKNESIKTAAFITNEDALIAKGAMLRSVADRVSQEAKKKGLMLDQDQIDYFTLVGYNSGEGNISKMMEKFAQSKDKKAWLEKGDVNWQRVHKNVSPRLKRIKFAQSLFDEKTN